MKRGRGGRGHERVSPSRREKNKRNERASFLSTQSEFAKFAPGAKEPEILARVSAGGGKSDEQKKRKKPSLFEEPMNGELRERPFPTKSSKSRKESAFHKQKVTIIARESLTSGKEKG